jgi:hypothetical protein
MKNQRQQLCVREFSKLDGGNREHAARCPLFGRIVQVTSQFEILIWQKCLPLSAIGSISAEQAKQHYQSQSIKPLSEKGT